MGRRFSQKPVREPMLEAFKNLKKKGLTYESLYRFLDQLRHEDVNDGVSYIKEYIENQRLPEQDIKYFQKLVSMLEGRKFAAESPNTKLDIDFKPKLFKKLMRVSQSDRINVNG